MLSMIDLHCDTLYEASKREKSLITNDLHLSFERLAKYSPVCQVLAVWSDSKLDCDGAWNRFFAARDLLASELDKCPSVKHISSDRELKFCEDNCLGAVILAVKLHFYVESCKLDEIFLALSDGKAIEKVCHRLGIICARTAADDYRCILTSVL